MGPTRGYAEVFRRWTSFRAEAVDFLATRTIPFSIRSAPRWVARPARTASSLTFCPTFLASDSTLRPVVFADVQAFFPFPFIAIVISHAPDGLRRPVWPAGRVCLTAERGWGGRFAPGFVGDLGPTARGERGAGPDSRGLIGLSG